MKRKIFFLTVVAAALLSVSCNKDGDAYTIKATINNFDTDSKVYIDSDNFSCWALGDAVMVNDAVGTLGTVSSTGRSGQITLAEEPTAPVYAVYPASAVTSTGGVTETGTTIHLPSMQKCILDDNGHQVVNAILASQGATTNGNTTLDFFNLCALLKVTVPSNITITDIYVTTVTDAGAAGGKHLWGNGSITFTGAGARPVLSDLTAGHNTDGVKYGGDTVYLHINEATSDGVYYITVPKVENTNYKVWVNYKNTVNSVNYFYCNIKKQSGGANTLLANQIGLVNFSDILIPDPDPLDPNEYIPGIYSISSTEKVNFAKGNMVFTVPTSGNDGNNYIWTYHTNQYTTAGYTITTHGSTLTGGSSEYSKMCLYTTSGTVVYPDNNGQYSGATFFDWGNFIDGSNTPETTDGVWFNLNQTQWSYLLYTRGVSYARFAKGTVNGSNGLLLFPDEFLWPDDALTEPTNLNNAGSGFTGFAYTVAEFQKLEDAGCVFLRANGYRDHNAHATLENENYGYYWTSDFDGNQTDSYLYFDGSIIAPDSDQPTNLHAGYAMSVRPVHRVQ